jgi:hypothetical protein
MARLSKQLNDRGFERHKRPAGAGFSTPRWRQASRSSAGAKLHVEPTPAPEMIEQLRQHKAPILELLTAERWADDPAEFHNWSQTPEPIEPIAWIDDPAHPHLKGRSARYGI